MLSHLQAHNRAIEKGIRDIEAYLKKVSDGVTLNEQGRARLQYNNVGLHLVVLPEHNIVIFKTFINLLPDPAAGTLLPLYYHLLDMNDEPQTGLAYFSIVAAEQVGKERDVISVETKRPIADISFDEFKAAMEAVGEVANLWMGRLESEFNAPPVP